MIHAPQLETSAAYAFALCARIAACTETPGAITRLFLSPATHRVHAILRAEMEALGMQVRVDAAGNLRGVYAAAESGKADSPAALRNDKHILLTGSHIDTVPNAGAFDGVLGVAVPLAALRALDGRRLNYAVEVIAFSEEEGIRFRMPFIGSRAVAGSLGEEDYLRQDAAGITIADALQQFGLHRAPPAAFSPGTFAFLEVHIEQGPVLEALGLPLGVVTAIVGQTRLEVTFRGRSNHAGTTPMDLRQDAVAAASAWVLAVERLARSRPGVVATVGLFHVEQSAANVIAGVARLSLDLRHADNTVREQAVAELIEEAENLGALRGVAVIAQKTSEQNAVAMDFNLTEHLAAAVSEVSTPIHRMVSGAGHDAMILAARVSAAMLFVRTPNGVSHHPDEAVAEADVALACHALYAMFTRLEMLP